MLDFGQLNISYLDEATLLSNSKIDNWRTQIDDNGEILYQEGTYYNCLIRLYPQIRIFYGSLHKLYNEITRGQNTNADDYSFSEITETIATLFNDIGLRPEKTIIENLEYGVNLRCPISPTDIIKKHFIVWKHYERAKNDVYGKDGSKGLSARYRAHKKSEYSIKIYDKGSQERKEAYIIRIEKSAIKNRILPEGTKRHIYLSDLLHNSYYEKLESDLLKTFDEFIIIDQSEPLPEMKRHEKEKWIKGGNPRTWSSIPEAIERRNFRTAFLKIQTKYGLDKVKNQLREAIISKWDELLHEDQSITRLRRNPFIEPIPFLQNTKSTTRRTCIITGIDISSQKKGSRFASPKTIEHLYYYDYDLFLRLITQLNLSQRKNETSKEFCARIWKAIKNRDSNLRLTYTRIKKRTPGQQILFEYESLQGLFARNELLIPCSN